MEFAHFITNGADVGIKRSCKISGIETTNIILGIHLFETKKER